MKNLFLSLLAVAGFFSVSNAQDQGDFEVGANLGFGRAIVIYSSDLNGGTEGTFGINFGATGEYYFSDRWGLKAKLLYDAKGWGNGYVQNIDTGEMYYTDFSLNYVTIPVMANWHFGRRRNWYLNFGLYTGFLLSAEDDEHGNDIKDALNATDVGLAVGIGYKVRLNSKTSIYFAYDEQYGFTDVFADGSSSGFSTQNDRGSFDIGVLFLLN
ncbi:porin family protein [Neptunitalea lumnitzerae]|uniref:Outer membrane protein beta-barrel domain-containing protein n=1 Tax=Neptunitalea lumnitzerae TaxID=2965509 RepID=A0ABQ5MLQ5_9FLAO|nr:porin family protein [Neptunitalea sp. Y10]GLB50353.1 hypothetical protein Y10_27210 [Neptunitalea sp. Y10]